MATASFTYNPEADYDYTDFQPSLRIVYAGSASEQREKMQTIARRTYVWSLRRNDTDRKSIDTFFRSRDQQQDAFYVKDPKDYAQTGVALGTATSNQTSFSMPTSGEHQRDFVIDDSNAKLYEDGALTSSTYTVNTDARTIGISTAPASGTVVTASYHAYRLVTLAAPFRWRMLAPNYFEASPQFVEVPA